MEKHLTVFVFILCLSLNDANLTAIQEFTNGNHLFTADVYKQINTNETGNFLVSPISVEIILALTQSGAMNETGEEIRTALHLPDSQEKIETAIKDLHPLLRQSELFTIQTANKIYTAEAFEINDDFTTIATDVFDSELETIDFAQNEEAANTINTWVGNSTENKITNLIDSELLNNLTRAILVNALYFKGNWSNPFNMDYTRNDSFYKSGSDVVRVETMLGKIETNFYEDKELDAKFLELPFDGDQVTMTVVLPNKNDGLEFLENNLEKVVVSPDYKTREVVVFLPKFKIESKIDFVNILQNLGVYTIFDKELVDLSGIAGEQGDFAVDHILQKSYIDVNENGVEAAAASYIDIVENRIGGRNARFIANHPFIFYLKVKDLILFVGRVVDPSA